MDAENREQEKDKQAEGQAGPKQDVSTNEELGIKRVRTFADDLAAAKASAGVKDTPQKKGLFGKKKKPKAEPVPEPEFENLPEVGDKELKPVEAQPEAPKQIVNADVVPPKQGDQPDKDYIEQELARSGIVTEDKIEKDTATDDDASWLSPIKTYKNDAAEAIEDKGVSQISLAAAEAQKRAENNDFSRMEADEEEPAGAGRSVIYILVSIVLVLGGGWGAFHFYKEGQKETHTIITVDDKAILFVNKEIEISAGNNEGLELLTLLNESREASSGGVNSIVRLIVKADTTFGEQNMKTTDLLERLEDVPDRLTRSLTDSFLLGVHTGEKKAPILVLKSNDPNTTFEAMLSWERTMTQDLAPLFGPRVGGNFDDVLLRNKDTRQLRSPNGELAIIYGFPNTETVVITTNENTFLEVLKRLASSGSAAN